MTQDEKDLEEIMIENAKIAWLQAYFEKQYFMKVWKMYRTKKGNIYMQASINMDAPVFHLMKFKIVQL